jgi:hypothetical protein
MASRSRLERDNLLSRFHVLRTEYDCLDSEARAQNKSADDEIQKLIKSVEGNGERKPQLPTPDLLRAFARFLVELYPYDRLNGRATEIIDNLRELTGETRSRWWNRQHPDRMASWSVAQQRAFLQELQRKRANITIEFSSGELLRSNMLKGSNVAALITTTVVGAIAGIMIQRCSNLSVYAIAGVCGAFGAWISVAKRIQGADVWGLARRAELHDQRTSLVWLSPVFGVIGAILVVLSIKTKFIGGTTAPDLALFASGEASGNSCDFGSGSNAAIVAFVVLVSLAAGWSERLVPDLLDWIGRRTHPSRADERPIPNDDERRDP